MLSTIKDIYSSQSNKDLKFDSHVSDKVNKANRILGLIRRTFMHLDVNEGLLNVQRRVTKLLPGFKDLYYGTHFQKLNLPTLAHRRLRADMIQFFNFSANIYDCVSIV